nr:hypothetical protein Iba_chr05cCG15650 [Ipomoea batatas]
MLILELVSASSSESCSSKAPLVCDVDKLCLVVGVFEEERNILVLGLPERHVLRNAYFLSRFRTGDFWHCDQKFDIMACLLAAFVSAKDRDWTGSLSGFAPNNTCRLMRRIDKNHGNR